MPEIRNRANHGIHVARLGRHIEAGEQVEVTPAEFDALRGHPLLEPVKSEPARKAKSEKEGEQE